MKRNLLICVIALLPLIVFPFIVMNEAHSFKFEDSEFGCGYPPLLEDPPSGRRNTWAINTQIKVFIGTNFNDVQKQGIKDAFTSFQDNKTINKSGVSFDFNEGTVPSSITSNYCEVRGTTNVPVNNDPGASGRGSMDPSIGTNWLNSAVIFMHTGVTLPRAIREVMTHGGCKKFCVIPNLINKEITLYDNQKRDT